MSEDWIVRSPTAVDISHLVTALNDKVPHLALRGDTGGEWAVVVDAADRPRLWVSGSRAALDGDETSFLTEVCAPGDGPIPPYGTPHLLVRDVVRAMASAAGGRAERLSAATVPDAARATVDVPEAVMQQRDSESLDCPADALYEKVGVVVQTRKELTLSPWLVLQQQWADRHGRQLAVITPAAATISPAVASSLRAGGTRWIVDTGASIYDGVTGAELSWDGERFAPTGRSDDAFVPVEEDGWVAVIEAETFHPYDETTRIGDFARTVYAAAGLDGPAAAGVLEPPETVFDPTVLTAYAQHASPESSRFVLASPSADGVLEVVPQPPGVVERVEIVADAPDGPMGTDAQGEFVDAVLAGGAQVATVGYRRGRADRRVASRFVGPTIPVVATFARSRFDSLTDAEAATIGGEHGRLVDRPVPALVVQHDVSAAAVEEMRSDDADDHPVARMDAILRALVEHDSHLRAAYADTDV
ncbi:DUF6177 family protein [Luteipulveratus flavus]|uniref:DUF6177 family protein n=1 Tax=Luteipulveratus flavus TaxID=3031728 RepID=A0ABT6C280_9MICO|nr:DUF6177 family protein [Luteipulveratus sp. YIM 133296]MDF8263014.1 DUF6177 family protein [Luteipulveratus sp. YIM 133296]